MPASKRKTEDPTAPRPTVRRPPALVEMGLPLAIGSAAVQAWADVGAEAFRFARDRLRHDITTQRAMLTCASLEEMQKIQAEFLVAAQKHYAAEAVRMLDLMGKAAVSGLTASAKARRYDDVPL